MEIFVHLGDDAARLEYVYFDVEIPVSVSIPSLARKPNGWRNEPPTEASMRVGDHWLKDGNSALLEVPSAIIPSETNLILNPLHPDTSKLKIGVARVFQFDPRMWK